MKMHLILTKTDVDYIDYEKNLSFVISIIIQVQNIVAAIFPFRFIKKTLLI